MIRLVVLTFAFLGWAFYEVGSRSGTDTPSALAQTSSQIESDSRETQTLDQHQMPAQVSQGSAQPANSPSRVANAVVLASLPARSLVSKAEPIRKPTLIDDLLGSEKAEQAVGKGASVGASVGVSAFTLNNSDIRMVRGNRANLRGGPGKDYWVVVTLSHGQQVEVLDREGSWVMLKVLETDVEGWMAEFLLVAAD